MDLKNKIKICLVVKLESIIDSIDGKKYCRFSQDGGMEECLIIGMEAINIKNNYIYPIIKKNHNGKISENLILNQYYVYQIFDYDKVKINDTKTVYPTYTIEEANSLANLAYENYKKIISYDKFLTKMKTKKK